MDIRELMEKNSAAMELMEKQVYVSNGSIVLDVGFILNDKNIDYQYYIELNRCNTYEDILGWIPQLCEKNWITVKAIDRFVYLAQKENGLKVSHI